ncbi:aldo/keto reductase [Rhizobium bangladeshense]|uniref:aldo/keto reductase n=1 Tax=Rhizobium bangladeshense TaxID=1138189 RepID=UPI001C915C9D|nr:aldo/keto reductase [Rhizobium bangladeshense]MBY3599209.1 aldo/keto reductase [Rhizobium bangladeshense]
MRLTRRSFVTAATVAAATAVVPSRTLGAAVPLARAIPSSGETMPAVGLGTWITFNVGDDHVLRDECTAVMDAFFEAGGKMIDCSPMYGSSQAAIGYGLKKLGYPKVFSAEKVWTSAENGEDQIERSHTFWGVPRFDLLQVHNLQDWEQHLAMLLDMKAAGHVRYVGITTSEGRRDDLFEEIMRKHPLDFVQFTYNIVDREAEERLLPLAAERGIAVIVNRPFQQGALTRRLEGEKLPQWAAELRAGTWAQFILKFILSHPAVTVAIPATTRVDHVRENLAAASGYLPDEVTRERMAALIRDL